ncbi:hypothetical protein V1264_013399 [Littorina saxatilis]|uniref:EGF-like domain-containing protein n=1 Tax=Littorina saxatilis TaxID=31220 RepID=A0AAN9BQG9_9CAEN
MGNFTATSRLNCVRECTSQPSCRSCTFCQVGATKTCALSTDHQPSCSALTFSDSQCSVAELMVDVCKNGGQFNKMTMECDCLENWEGNVCEKSRSTFPAVTTPAPPQTGTAQYSQTTKKDCKGLLCPVGEAVESALGLVTGG